ncbi:MAG: HAD hydrolase-like protein [Clostridia bacterium]|nr:HAD hydrolase-like protein [Clostridia bacterium]
MRYPILFFDLDGTLADTTEGVLNGVRYALENMGRPVPSPEELRPFMGPPLTESFERFTGMSPEDAKRAEDLYRVYYRDKGIFETKEYPGMRELLQTLKDTPYRMAVATSKLEPNALNVLGSFGYLPFFETVSGSTKDGSVSSKTDVILQAQRRMDCGDPSAILMIGDRKYDILGAHALGLAAAGIYTGTADDKELEDAGADYVVHSPEALLDLLLLILDL